MAAEWRDKLLKQISLSLGGFRFLDSWILGKTVSVACIFQSSPLPILWLRFKVFLLRMSTSINTCLNVFSSLVQVDVNQNSFQIKISTCTWTWRWECIPFCSHFMKQLLPALVWQLDSPASWFSGVTSEWEFLWPHPLLKARGFVLMFHKVYSIWGNAVVYQL